MHSLCHLRYISIFAISRLTDWAASIRVIFTRAHHKLEVINSQSIKLRGSNGFSMCSNSTFANDRKAKTSKRRSDLNLAPSKLFLVVIPQTNLIHFLILESVNSFRIRRDNLFWTRVPKGTPEIKYSYFSEYRTALHVLVVQETVQYHRTGTKCITLL